MFVSLAFAAALTFVPYLTLAAGNSGEFVRLPRVGFRELPLAIQAKIEDVERECLAPPEEIPNTYAYTLDINRKFKSDFIHVPGAGIKTWPHGFGGYCNANGTWLILWVANDRGGYSKIDLGDAVAILKSQTDYIFTTWCAGDMASPSVSLAVLDLEGAKLVPFGRCYATIGDALRSARQKGYRVVSFR
jgi:hypothetical protein